MVAKKKKRNVSGQAAIETALSLPIIIWLLYYTLNSFMMFRTSHTGQKFAAMNVYQRLSNRAKFTVDAKAQAGHNNTFMAVQYTDVEGNTPKRRIIDEGGASEITNTVGICREWASPCQ